MKRVSFDLDLMDWTPYLWLKHHCSLTTYGVASTALDCVKCCGHGIKSDSDNQASPLNRIPDTAGLAGFQACGETVRPLLAQEQMARLDEAGNSKGDLRIPRIYPWEKSIKGLESMATVTDIGTLLVRTPEVCKGRPRVAGTGVTVRRIVGWYKIGLSPEEIADRIGHLSLAQIHAALAYYHANREEVEADIAAEEAADYEGRSLSPIDTPVVGAGLWACPTPAACMCAWRLPWPLTVGKVN